MAGTQAEYQIQNLILKIKFLNSKAMKEKTHFMEEKKDLIDWSGK